MEPLHAAEKLKVSFPEEVLDVREFRGEASVTLRKDRIVEICRFLHDEPDLFFDFLVNLCGTDYLGRKDNRFEVVYNLYSIRHRHALRLKAEVPEKDISIASVVPVWAGANWLERECFDMFGIIFTGHPDLRRVLLPADWEGYPLRKDYPLKGPEKEWQGFSDVLEKAKRLKKFEWNK